MNNRLLRVSATIPEPNLTRKQNLKEKKEISPILKKLIALPT